MSDLLRLDCDGCEVRGLACGDCVVSVLLGGPPADTTLDDTDQAALAVLADSGLVPPLRLASSTKNPIPPDFTKRDDERRQTWREGA